MAQSKQALRQRIKSVGNTRKITSAMEMIANAKLFKQRNRMEANRIYATRLQKTLNEIVAKNPRIDEIYLKPHKSTKKAYIVFCSDLGLCGGYNANVLKQARLSVNKEDPIIVIGTSLMHALKEEGYHILNDEPISSDKLEYMTLKTQVERLTHMYLDDEVCAVCVLYTNFVNTMTFRPEVGQLLPAVLKEKLEEAKQEAGEHLPVETLFEPDAETILDALIPMMVQEVSYSMWMETTTAEQGSRRMAMKTATDNADELRESLMLEYNKARQAAITQEITEIVSGSSAV